MREPREQAGEGESKGLNTMMRWTQERTFPQKKKIKIVKRTVMRPAYHCVQPKVVNECVEINPFFLKYSRFVSGPYIFGWLLEKALQLQKKNDKSCSFRIIGVTGVRTFH